MNLDWDAVQSFWRGEARWVVQAFAVVAGSLLADFFLRRFVNRVHRRLSKGTRTPWDDAVVDALRRPLSLVVWIAGIALAAQIAREATGAAIFAGIPPLRDLGIVSALTWFLIRLVNNGQGAYLSTSEGREGALDPATLDALVKLLRMSILITAALVALQTLGFSISGLLAFGGIGGIAVGFAAKDLLANFFGGLMIYLDRPFVVGEWIRSPDQEIEGTVEEIGWRLTRIRTFDARPLYVPNSVFSTISVENPSRMTNRRIYETIGIRYQDGGKLPGIVAEVKAMLEAHPEIDSERTMIVTFNAFAASSLDFFIYTFTRTVNWVQYHAVKQDVLFKVMEIIAGHGAEIAYPTSTLHLHPEAPELVDDGRRPEG